MNQDHAFDLSGKLLIAMPSMEDPHFHSCVILICAHSDEGAMGLVINRPHHGISFEQLLTQLNIAHSAGKPNEITVHFGGPVDRGRGFVLHSHDYALDGITLQITPDFALTSTQDILQALARGNGPEQVLLALGYAGWAPGQLEGEISRNDWLVADASADLVFARNDDGKWRQALDSFGINPLLLSSTAGHA